MELPALFVFLASWHGADWKFVVSGGYRGAVLPAERAAGRAVPRVVTFLVVSVG